MAATEQVEIELKFDVSANHPAPSFAGLDGVDQVSEPQTVALYATYFDTENLDLASNRMTLRRRVGGDDEGWHLKQPALVNFGAVNTRREIQVTFDDAPMDADVPAELMRPILAITRRRRLMPVAAISTSRTTTELLDDEGHVVAVFCDDLVTAQSLLPDGQSQSWSEWEFELVGGTGSPKGDRKLLKQVRKILLGAGAQVSSSQSKLARAIGSTPFVGQPHLGSNPTALELVVTDIALHRNALVAMDPLVRIDAYDAVHQMRVATRKLRSVLASFPSVLDPTRTAHVNSELRLLAQILGTARDSEVQIALATDLLAGEDASDTLKAALVDDETKIHDKALAVAHSAMNSRRYFALLDSIDQLIAAPPAGVNAEAPARKVVASALRKVRKKIGDDQDTLSRLPERSYDWEEHLHTIRKRAKKLRYTAEAAEALGRKEFDDAARAAKKVQAALGDYNDSRINRDRLVKIAEQPQLSARDRFVLGRIDARQQVNGERALQLYWKAASEL
ncbi:CYTH and CHAD domain-containing protein [Gordonia asplenii]|uniref:CYTH and CHAD domain-containing protein n=1 Tax=Gordonia asplenii TaxID=2725283 RepID=UPI0028A649C1|nr:CYTH and CHAD domain-containing protein [Gordonia asplenii]